MRLRSLADDAAERFPAPAEQAPAERARRARLLDEGDPRVDPLVVAAFTADDPVAEAARTLRGHIVGARGAAGQPARFVALAGIDAEGETALIAANTAVACAHAGYRTLLVDAVLGSPALHILLRVPAGPGLSALLAAPEGQDRSAIQNTAIAGLALLPAGPVVARSEPLFDRGRLFERLRGIGERYDHVLVLAPGEPHLAAAACEGLDGVILLARRDASDARKLDALADRLAARDTPILGAVLSD